MNDSYLAGGPFVWLVTIAITTVLLIASTQALWLVVPLLIAIILYYIVFPWFGASRCRASRAKRQPRSSQAA